MKAIKHKLTTIGMETTSNMSLSMLVHSGCMHCLCWLAQLNDCWLTHHNDYELIHSFMYLYVHLYIDWFVIVFMCSVIVWFVYVSFKYVLIRVCIHSVINEFVDLSHCSFMHFLISQLVYWHTHLSMQLPVYNLFIDWSIHLYTYLLRSLFIYLSLFYYVLCHCVCI